MVIKKRRIRSFLTSKVVALTAVAALVAQPLYGAVAPQIANAASSTVCADLCTYTSIQAAVDAAQPEGTITVGAGTYNESVNVNKSLTILGAQSGVDARNRTGAGESIVIGGPTYNDAAFRINAANVTIDGFTLGPDAITSGVNLIGVDVGSSDGTKIKNSIIHNNQRGISLVNGADNTTIEKNVIANNNANAENNAGIWGDYVTQITIQNNNLIGHSNTAINLLGSTGVAIKNNTATNNGSLAAIAYDTDVTIEGNSGTGFTGSAVFVALSTNVTIQNNPFGGGAATGVSLEYYYAPSTNVEILNNDLSNFGTGVNIAAGATQGTVKINNNKFTNNATAGVASDAANSKTSVDATSNWWGSIVGPNMTASTKATNVVYDPWCTDSSCSTLSNASPVKPVLVSPANGAFTNNPAFDNVWKAVPGATHYQYRTANSIVNSTTLGRVIYEDDSATATNYDTTSSTTITRHNNSGTPDATYYWQARAINGNGVASSWSDVYKVTVDTTKPNPVVVTPTAGQKVSGTTPISVQTNDTNIHYTYIEINQNGAWKNAKTINGADSTWNFDTTTLPDGNYTIKVDATDYAGNGAETTRNFTIGNPPVITNVTPADGSLLHGLVTFGLTTNDANLSYTYMEWNQNGIWKDDNTTAGATSRGSTNAGNNPKLVINTADYADGTYGLKIDSVDRNGNTTEKLLTYTIDNTAPKITVKDGSQFTVGSNGTYSKVSFALFDAGKVKGFTINNGNFRPLTPSMWSDANFIGVGENGGVSGANIFTLEDLAGNTTTYRFTLDNQKPTVGITDATNQNGSLVVTGITNDNAAVVRVSVNSVTGTATNNGNGGWTYTTVAPVTTGSYPISASATDQAGNSSSTATYAYEVAPPAPAQSAEGGRGEGTGNSTPNSGSTPSAPSVATANVLSTPAALVLGTGLTSTVASTDSSTSDSTDTQGVLGAQTENDPYDVTSAAVAGDSIVKDAVKDGAGFAWYWWVLIVAVAAALAWSIYRFVAARRAAE